MRYLDTFITGAVKNNLEEEKRLIGKVPTYLW